MAKTKKKREKKYDEKLAIEGSFEDVIKLSVQSQQKQKEDGRKKTKTSTNKRSGAS